MSISAISSSSSYTNPFAKIKEDFQDIGTALQSGSLSDAQAAYETLQSDTTSESSDSSNPMNKDIESLGSALESGNLADAQKVLSKIEQHLKGHGEFAKQQMDIEAALSTSSSDTSNDSSTSSDADTLQKSFQALSDALSSGNLSDAQTALAALQKEVSSQNGGQSNDPFSQDLQSLGDALESGSLTDAQDIFSNIEDKLSSPPQGPPPGPPPGNGQAQGSDSEDTVANTLQALLDALNENSSSTSSTSTSTSDTSEDDPITTLKALLTSALKSYQQMSSSQYADDAANSASTLLSSTV